MRADRQSDKAVTAAAARRLAGAHAGRTLDLGQRATYSPLHPTTHCTLFTTCPTTDWRRCCMGAHIHRPRGHSTGYVVDVPCFAENPDGRVRLQVVLDKLKPQTSTTHNQHTMRTASLCSLGFDARAALCCIFLSSQRFWPIDCRQLSVNRCFCLSHCPRRLCRPQLGSPP